MGIKADMGLGQKVSRKGISGDMTVVHEMWKPGFCSDFWPWPTLLCTDILCFMHCVPLCLCACSWQAWGHSMFVGLGGVRLVVKGKWFRAHMFCFPHVWLRRCVCVCVHQHRDNCRVIRPWRSLCTNCLHGSFLIICSPTSFSRIMGTAITLTKDGRCSGNTSVFSWWACGTSQKLRDTFVCLMDVPVLYETRSSSMKCRGLGRGFQPGFVSSSSVLSDLFQGRL